jgi:hypothetical protein
MMAFVTTIEPLSATVTKRRPSLSFATGPMTTPSSRVLNLLHSWRLMLGHKILGINISSVFIH